MHKKKILIFGGAGYIGLELLKILSEEKNSKITVFDLFIFNSISSIKKRFPKIKFIKGDINKTYNDSLFKNQDVIIHLAGLANDPSSDINPNNTVLTNHISTIELAKKAKKYCKKFIYASSCSVYGDNGKKIVDEKFKTRPLTLYALSKYASEQEILKLSSKKFQVISLRFATLFGYSKRMRFDLGINTMTANYIKNKSLTINGDGQQFRAFVHVKDVAECINYFTFNNSNFTNQIYNIGSNENNIQILKLAKIFKKTFPDIEINFDKSKKDFRSYRVNFDKIQKQIKNYNFISIEYGIAEIFDNFKNKKFNFHSNKYHNLKKTKKL